MTTFPCHDIASSPSAARPLLEEAAKSLGFVPNLFGQLAEAPPVLHAYIQLSGLFDKTSLTPAERQVVLLAVSVENTCEFCVAAHSFIARNAVKVDGAVIDRLRAGGRLDDAKLDALANFTRQVVRQRGKVAHDSALRALFAAGYSPQTALDVILGVTMKTLSNYASHLTEVSVNEQFQSERWLPKAVA